MSCVSVLIYPRQQDADTHEKKNTVTQKKENNLCLFSNRSLNTLTAEQSDKAKHFLTHTHTKQRHTLNELNVSFQLVY